MKIKKILTGVLAAVLAASAAACGDGGNTTTEDRNHIEMYVLDAGYRTADIMSEGMKQSGCEKCGEIIVSYLK